jgi:eukaryotic-like serine/threonine-protein kinase
MSLFTNFRAERLIADIKAAAHPGEPGAKEALAKLGRLGPSAIPRIIDALASADGAEATGYVALLASMLDQKTFPLVAKGLADGNPRTVSWVAQAIASSRNYPTTLLYTLLEDPKLPKGPIVGILAAQKARLAPREVLKHAYAQEPLEKTQLFRIVTEIADESLLPELLLRLEGKDPVARTHIINMLARFDRPEVAKALQVHLKDPNRLIRQATLAALAHMSSNADIALLCGALRDPDTETQQKAIEAVVRANHPDTIRHLVTVLRDEDENCRRAAVEVLNEIGTPAHVRFLLQAIKDDDWWVRSRSADALAKIGGPRVIEAALELIRDQDEDVRRAAIEIINQTRDERAVDMLIEATRDSDWWVRERAVDALADIGNPRAMPAIAALLDARDPRSLPSVVRALGKLGDASVVRLLLPLLQHEAKEVRLEVITSLTRLVDDVQAQVVRVRLQTVGERSPEPTVSHAALRAVEDLDSRFSSTAVAARDEDRRMAEPSKTLLADSREIGGLAEPAAEESRIDVSTLKPGEVLEGRYKYVEKIGKGAFGTVLLMEDTVVDERLVLKFLNPNVSQDEEMLRRFVHELRYSRKITHRNVIRIYDFLYIRGNYAISMEYFPSHTLGGEINEKPLPVPKAVRYATDIATGMAVAHQVGIVHRDLKPANVLINGEGLLKIVDFGVAATHREGDTQLTKTGYVIGSPKYMAPEQILGKKVDERADIYSLGVILYEMLCGEPPYHRGDHMAVMYQHVQGKAKPPGELNPRLPEGLSELTMKAMTVDKTKRFQSMDELRTALEKYL